MANKVKSRLFGVLLCTLAVLAILNCSTTKAPDYSFERSVQEPMIEKRCVAGAAIDTTRDCYLLKWHNPVDTVHLLRVHVWLDTNVIGSAQESVPDSALKSSHIKEFNALAGSSTESMDLSDLLKGMKISKHDTVQIALWGEYSDNGTRGRIVHAIIVMGDDIPPARIQFADSESYNSMVISWVRPIDQTDFYHQDSIDGPIRGYNFYVEALDTSTDLTTATVSLFVNDQPANAVLSNQQHWLTQSDNVSLQPLPLIHSQMNYAIRDSLGFQSDLSKNKFKVIISGVSSEKSFYVEITAYDWSGLSSSSEKRLIRTTDSIPPVIPTSLQFRNSPIDAGHVMLVNNRVVFYWLKAVDPLVKDASITAEQAFAGNVLNSRYRNVKSYTVQFLNNGVWMSLLRPSGDTSNPVNSSYSVVGSDSLSVDATGGYVSDTLRWIVPGQKIRVRMRAVDSSGAVSPWIVDSSHVASRGLAATYSCPAGYVPVHKRMSADTSNYAVFCIEAYEHQNSQGFVRDILYSQARSSCQTQSSSVYSVDLCSEDDWFSACADGGSSYGTIQETPFYASDFLSQYCNLGTSDTAVTARDSRCVSASGVHDLPGQLQEWARGSQPHYDTSATGVIDSSKIDSVGVLKGSSYVAFSVSDKTLQAKCSAISRPARQRPKYTDQPVYVYRGSNNALDTLLVVDTSRILLVKVDPSSFNDSIVIYKVSNLQHDSLGLDYFDAVDLRRRKGTDSTYIADAFEMGYLHYTLIGGKRVRLLSGTAAVPGSANYFLDHSVGYRCCAIHH